MADGAALVTAIGHRDHRKAASIPSNEHDCQPPGTPVAGGGRQRSCLIWVGTRGRHARRDGSGAELPRHLMRGRDACEDATSHMSSLRAIGYFSRALLPGLLSALAVSGPSACDGGVAREPTISTGGTATAGAGSGGQDAEVFPTGGSEEAFDVVCSDQEDVSAPTPSEDCSVVARDIDPAFTCGSDDCSLTKALDLTCASRPDEPWISATADGAVVMVRARSEGSDTTEALARLMLVGAGDSRVQDVPELADPDLGRAGSPILDSAMITDPSGARWLFTGEAQSFTARRETDAGWTRSKIVTTSDDPYRVDRLGNVAMVHDGLGYLAYLAGPDYLPHLLTWDGLCWADERLGETPATSVTVRAWITPITPAAIPAWASRPAASR